MSPEVPVHHQFDQSHGDDREGQHQQDGGDQGHPNENGHSHHGHARAPHVDDGHQEVQGGSHRRYSQYQQAQGPEIQAGIGAVGCSGQVGVREPTGIRDLTYQETGVHQKGAEKEDPIAEGVQPWKCYVSGADGQGHDKIEETGAQGHDYHEHHGGGVHGEQPVEGFRPYQGVVRLGQLGAHDAGLGAGDQKHNESGYTVEHPDAFVVNGGDPAPYSGVTGRPRKDSRDRCHGPSPTFLLPEIP